MNEGQQPGCDHARLGRIEIIDLNANVIQRPTLHKYLGLLGRIARGVERHIMII